MNWKFAFAASALLTVGCMTDNESTPLVDHTYNYVGLTGSGFKVVNGIKSANMTLDDSIQRYFLDSIGPLLQPEFPVFIQNDSFQIHRTFLSDDGTQLIDSLFTGPVFSWKSHYAFQLDDYYKCGRTLSDGYPGISFCAEVTPAEITVVACVDILFPDSTLGQGRGLAGSDGFNNYIGVHCADRTDTYRNMLRFEITETFR